MLNTRGGAEMGRMGSLGSWPVQAPNRPSPKPRLNYLDHAERKLLIQLELSLQGVSLTTRSATEKAEPELSHTIPRRRHWR